MEECAEICEQSVGYSLSNRNFFRGWFLFTHPVFFIFPPVKNFLVKSDYKSCNPNSAMFTNKCLFCAHVISDFVWDVRVCLQILKMAGDDNKNLTDEVR